MANAYVRGAVTGIGVVTAFVGLRDLSATILARGADVDRPGGPPAGIPSL
jgi:hypothetical protein